MVNKPKGMSLGVIKTSNEHYELRSKLADGRLARVYEAVSGSGELVAIKVVTHEANNTLLLNEGAVLEKLSIRLLPEIVDCFRTEDDRVGLIFKKIDGINASEIRRNRLYRKGIIDTFHLGWLIEHQLGLAAKLHKARVVHGNIHPETVIVTPATHDVRFIDFCYAHHKPTADDRVWAWTEGYSAPEIREGVPPLPGMDIYSIGKVAVYLAGGDVQTGKIPDSIGLDPRVRSFIDMMIEPNYLDRPRDSLGLARAFLQIRRDVWGPARWVDFPV